jgi:aspartate racemase|uniref:Aspartate racemase n=1 Tax=Globisporangium ultimum (strain ATCC 200006 / CBS 805.95 / DAOM BR144) TaxID=431595 RepID=K3X2J9_GLOUD
MRVTAPTTIGVLGGVGPAAGILLHQTILQHTESNGVDQGHLNVCHFSRPADIASRVEFLIAYNQQYGHPTSAMSSFSLDNKSTSRNGSEADAESVDGKAERRLKRIDVENPADGMARTFEMLRKLDVPVVAGIPCITFHVKPIWNEFLRLISQEDHASAANDKAEVRCLNMLDETMRLISEVAPSSRRIGVMSTIGTREARVFHDLLESRGYEVVEVSEDTQLELQDTIQNPVWGIKSNAPNVRPQCITNFHKYARQLVADGAELLILGCTEIPFAFMGLSSFEGVPLLDPLVALARALIREVDPLRLKSLTLR